MLKARSNESLRAFFMEAKRRFCCKRNGRPPYYAIMRTILLTTLAGFGLGLVLWTVGAILESLAFAAEPFWTIFLFGSSVYALAFRIILLLGFTLAGLVVGIIYRRYRQSIKLLHDKEQQERWLIDHAADAILVTDQNGNYIDVNEKACTMLGYTRTELLHLNVRDVVLPSELAQRPFQFDVLRDGQTVWTERTLLRKDGTQVVTEVHVRMLPDGRFEAIARDISERRVAEQALRQSEARFRAIFEGSSIGISVADENGRFLAINQAMADMLGYEIDEMLTMSFMDVTHPDDVDTDLKMVQKLRAGEIEQMHIEKRYLHKDGRPVWVSLRVVVFPGANDSPAMTIGMAVDITERRQAEQALQRLLRAYRVLSDCNQAVVRATDEKSLMQQVCQILVQIGNFRLAWVGFVRQDNDQAVHPVAYAGESSGYLDSIQISIEDDVFGRGPTGTALRERRTVVTRDIAADPDYRPWREPALSRGFRSSIALPLMTDAVLYGALNIYAAEANVFDETEVGLLEELAGDLTLGISLLRNDIARRQSEAALRSSELRFRGFFDNGAVPMAIVSTDGHVVEANEANTIFLGYSLDELIGMHFADLTFPEDIALDTSLYNSLLQGEREGYTIDKRYIRKDGEVVWGRLSVAAIRGEMDEVQYTAVVCQDITARKEVQEAMMQMTLDLEQRVTERTAELEAANKRLQQLTEVKDKFVENVSHELRTPITNIKLYNDLMMRRSDRAQTYLARSEQEIDRLAGLIEDLLTLSRLDQEERPLVTTPVLLNDLIRPLVEARISLAEQKNLQLQFTAAADMPPLQVEPELLAKAVSILILNAITYTPAGGMVIVNTLLQDEDDAPRTGISVQDSGPGVTREEQQKIFERFYRGQAGRISGTPGTGLGLAIVQEIAWLHDGTVTVESDGVNGARFILWLPID